MTTTTHHGARIFTCPAEGPLLLSERDAADLVGDAGSEEAEWVVVPATRLHPDFFVLKTRAAGLFVQKLVNYRLRLAILGDIDAHVAKSDALRDFVRESNRGHHLWFVRDAEELDARLAASRKG
jgi:hypothetical protein